LILNTLAAATRPQVAVADRQAKASQYKPTRFSTKSKASRKWLAL
jgi:hypothetical protein